MESQSQTQVCNLTYVHVRAHTHSQSGGLQLLELTFPFLRVEQINLPTG